MAVAWNYGVFIARYPEFANANANQLASMFVEAGLYLDNSAQSPVQNLQRLQLYLNMLTAHIAFLGGLLTADGQSRPVGRVSDASEGSVSASFEYSTPTPGTAAWFNQSQYGAAFWAATSSLRSARYRARPTDVGPPYPRRWGF